MAANRQQVPKFGNWDEDAPLTVVFDKARGGSSKKPNTVYPKENPELFENTPKRNYRPDQSPSQNVRPRHERFSSREETEFRPFTPSPAHTERNNRVRQHSAETYNYHQPYGGGRSAGETRRPTPQDHVPVQTRPIPNLRGNSRERVATIPPFPGSGSENQSYTLIFDKVKEERSQNVGVRSHGSTPQPTFSARPTNDRQQSLPSSPKGCCFPAWSRKRSY